MATLQSRSRLSLQRPRSSCQCIRPQAQMVNVELLGNTTMLFQWPMESTSAERHSFLENSSQHSSMLKHGVRWLQETTLAFELWRGLEITTTKWNHSFGIFQTARQALLKGNGPTSLGIHKLTGLKYPDCQTRTCSSVEIPTQSVFCFHSDNSGASEGMHVDDFIQFGVSKVSDFTLDVDCDNPEAGFSSPPSNTVSLHCLVTNNGYSSATISVYSNVTNLTWMDPAFPSIRIETTNPNDFFSPVIIQGLGAGKTTDVYVNISIPAGADVQQQTWQVWFMR